MNKQLSKCCSANVKPHYGDEGTNYYECTKCGQPCDIEPTQTKKNLCKPKDLDWEKEEVAKRFLVYFGSDMKYHKELAKSMVKLLTHQHQLSVTETVDKVKEMIGEIRSGQGKQGQSALDFLSVKINQLSQLNIKQEE